MHNYFKLFDQRSKMLTAYYKILHIFLGIDFGFFKYKSYRMEWILKCLSFLRCLLICFSIMYTLHYFRWDPTFVLWHGIYLLNYMSYVTIFLFLPSNASLAKFQNEMQLIDLKLGAEKTYRRIERKEIFTIFLCYLYKFGMIIFYCHKHVILCAKPLWISVTDYFIMLSLDTLSITNSFVFYSVYRRLVIFAANLKAADDQSILPHLHLYKSIVDVAEKIKHSYDSLFLTAIVFNVPLVMGSIYHTVWMLRHEDMPLFMLPIRQGQFTIVVALSVTLAPALFAGKVSAEASRIKILLYDKLLLEDDVIKCHELRKFIRYVEARPLKFTVYNVIPLNAHLLSMTFNFSITYLIVMIQLAHLD